ncbi:DUF397 domain-containing protein [Actinopolyspora mortivallis]|uniref:DUF397 domain-containing protein n=1 Tax=Actinopolyspora mortivallis TaxID=33906 RepID=UPI000381CB16|nr:DUF397 domain-containing protein [Actinopolyspora mortivallis]
MVSQPFGPTTAWRKSSRSGSGGPGGGNCVEVAFGPGITAVRDSKTPHDGTLTIPSGTWTTFLTALRTGRYDH